MVGHRLPLGGRDTLAVADADTCLAPEEPRYLGQRILDESLGGLPDLPETCYPIATP